MMHPQYIQILEGIHAEFPDMRIVQYTNGSMLHDADIRNAVLQHVASLVISVDGATNEAMKATRPGLDPEAVTDGIMAVAHGRKGNGPHVTIRMTRLPINRGTEDAYRAMWEPFCDKLSFQPLQGYHGRDQGPKHRGGDPCDRPFHTAVVHVNGNVVLCCDDYDGECVLGNVHDAGLAEIWNGAALTAIRTLHRTGLSANLPMCRACSYHGTLKSD
jgi:radical SAM protein with 4Fe4S-binding SPASM domain